MKRAGILLSFLCFFASVAFAQDSLHVKWQLHVGNTAFKKYSIDLTGSIQPGWHLYTNADKKDALPGLELHFDDTTIQQETSKITGIIKDIPDPIFQNKKTVAIQQIEFAQAIKTRGEMGQFKFKVSYYIGNDTSFLPEQKEFIYTDSTVVPAKTLGTANQILITSIDLNHPINNCGGTDTSGSLWQLFFFGILGGLASLFTPCFFPMLPLTVSFFTNKSGDRKKGIRNASLYGFFIFSIYVLLSLPFYFISNGSSEILNNISTSPLLNTIFFIVFVFFAISFFGYYEISLPDKFTNSANSKAGIGTTTGIFFMALTLALVSFSCTGPLLGTLVVSSLKPGMGGAFQLTVAMAGFGLSLGIPFALFAMFPNLLNKLPKSGGWLHTFKVVLGFLELAFALKFLSNADQAEHWGILKREVFIGIWIIIGIGITVYLFGLSMFPHDVLSEKLPKSRIAIAVLFGMFTIYLIPGLTNTKYANLSLISGFPPPLSYSIYHNASDCLFDLDCSHDFQEGLKMAKEENKPILLDFTGYACVNCRRMEENVWSRPDILKIMREKFIVISLYVDDKKELPTAEQFTYTTKDGAEKEIRTVGDKWATFETENFQSNAQPLYALINADGILLTHPVNYTAADDYKMWLVCGLDAFSNKK